jgi:drug/metabolite transporter (DMT)-like permease
MTVDWKPVGINELQLLFVASLFLIFGYLFSVMTMRVGEISFVSPFRYSILIWAIILGIVVFDDIPDGWTVFGSTIVVLTGIYTFYRERNILKAAREASTLDAT